MDSLIAKVSGHCLTTDFVNRASVEWLIGQIEAAEVRLRRLRDQFDRSAKVAPVSELASLATDDTRRQFRPAGYEQVMIRTMLALCSLAGDQIDAERYALQATEKQKDSWDLPT